MSLRDSDWQELIAYHPCIFRTEESACDLGNYFIVGISVTKNNLVYPCAGTAGGLDHNMWKPLLMGSWSKSVIPLLLMFLPWIGSIRDDIRDL